jgi:hypothetical protein
MAIMTGIKSAQIVGPGSQKQTSTARTAVGREKIGIPVVRGLNGSIIDQIV